MTTWHKLVAAVVSALLAALLLTLWAFRGLLGPTCANDILAEVPAPGTSRRAVVFVRRCGSGAVSTDVSILAAGTSLSDGAGNVFVVKAAHGDVEAGPDGAATVHVSWVSPNLLRVHRDARLRPILASHHVEGVGIEYIDDE